MSAKGVEGLKARVDGENVTLVLPIKILVSACEQNPEFPLKVKDEKALAKFIARHLTEHDEDEAGNSALKRLLDELFVAAYEDDVPLVRVDSNSET